MKSPKVRAYPSGHVRSVSDQVAAGAVVALPKRGPYQVSAVKPNLRMMTTEQRREYNRAMSKRNYDKRKRSQA